MATSQQQFDSSLPGQNNILISTYNGIGTFPYPEESLFHTEDTCLGSSNFLARGKVPCFFLPVEPPHMATKLSV